MFANAFQSGFISIFYSVGSAPLSIWNKEVKNGHIRRIVDEEVKSLVLEIAGNNVATTYITCPQKPRASLAIKLPFLVMIIKNMKKYFTFEIQILDDKDIRRRFRVSNFQSTTKVRPFCTTMPIGLSDGWNQVQFNLADFTKRAYGSTYLETVRVQVHANVRIRRIYFSDTLYSEDEMPNEFRLFLPTAAAKAKAKDKDRGKIEKKPVAKAPAVEQVPSGAPPSPAEGARSPSDAAPGITSPVLEEVEATVPEEVLVEPEAPILEEPTTAEVVTEVVETPVEEAAPIEGEVLIETEPSPVVEEVVQEIPIADTEAPSKVVADSVEVQGVTEVPAAEEVVEAAPVVGEEALVPIAGEEQVPVVIADVEAEAVPPAEEGDLEKAPNAEEAPAEEIPAEAPPAE